MLTRPGYDAVDLLRRGGSWGWSLGHARHPRPGGGALLLVDASAAADHDRFADTQLSALLDAVDHVGWPFYSTERHEPEGLAALMAPQPEQAERVPGRPTPFSRVLYGQLAAGQTMTSVKPVSRIDLASGPLFDQAEQFA